ncbi:hypothetical protein Tco_1292221 [Tanacetum coccineum]
MDIRDEMSLSKDDMSPKSSSLRVSDQNKHRNKLLGVKDKPHVGSLSPKKWRTRDMIVAAKHGDKVLNVQPVFEFNPTTGIQVLKPLVKKLLVVRDRVKDKASVKKPADVVEKPNKVKDKATVKKPADVVEKPVTVVVKDKVTVKKPAVVATVKKPANVVEKPVVLVKEKDKDKAQVSIVKENDVVPDVGLEKVVANDKEKKIVNDVVPDVGLEKLNTPADVADKESDVMNNKDKESDVAKDVGNDVVNDFVNDVVADVGLDKFGANELLSDVSVVKPAVKPAVKPSVKPALKPAVKGNESKKLKSKYGMKRKKKNYSDSLSSSVDEKELRRLLKNIKQEDSDGSVSDKKMKYKKKEKELTPSKAAHEEYLKHYPTLHAKAVPKSLFAAIRGSHVDISSTYKLSLDSGDSIHVTLSKIHDILGIPVGGISLFSLEARPVEHEFVKSVAGLKGEICLDVVRRLREDSDISKIDWCGYIHSCLEDSKIPKKRTVQYLGPFLFLILLYLDSTKFDGVPVVRTRPAIRAWNSTLMRQREKLELKEHVLGLLELHDESTGGGSMLTSEKEAKAQVIPSPARRITKEIVVFYGDNDDNDEDGGNGDDVGLVFSKHFDKPPSGSGELSKKNKVVQRTVDGVEGDKDLSCSNPSFGFSKITLDDFGNGSCKSPNNPVAKKELVDPIQEGTVVEGNPAEECEIMSTLESYTQWLETNSNLVGEIVDAITDEYLYGDLFGDNSVRREVSNQGPPTPDRLPNRASHASVSLGKRIGDKIHNLCLTEPWLLIMLNGKAFLIKLRLSLAAMKKKLFARHLKLYGHNRHAKDCGLVGESGLHLDMLRRLCFKFSRKMLLHEINVHAQNMLDLANEFNKLDSYVKMSIIVDALKNRKERDCI